MQKNPVTQAVSLYCHSFHHVEIVDTTIGAVSAADRGNFFGVKCTGDSSGYALLPQRCYPIRYRDSRIGRSGHAVVLFREENLLQFFPRVCYTCFGILKARCCTGDVSRHAATRNF